MTVTTSQRETGRSPLVKNRAADVLTQAEYNELLNAYECELETGEDSVRS